MAKKALRPYWTNYPAFFGKRWMWFDVAFWREYPPQIGNIPTAVFDRLKGGPSSQPGLSGHTRLREYKSEADAWADYEQAVKEQHEADQRQQVGGRPQG